ncbi:GntR family transcriptional regulator [uncultured Robinsoniella sp.]|uniref:GntR family transcriptional regulator n=1 Tax=uncultured Robinsoniella sp. TaxID=904190 RepID=UPI00374F1FC6
MLNSEKPIFQQIMEMIEDDIISGTYQVNDIIISTTQISKLLSVNPTTSVKAVSNLAEEGVLYKKRGIGMCVAQGARDKILARRKKMFFEEAVPELLIEANKLGISETELIQTIRKEKEQYD